MTVFKLPDLGEGLSEAEVLNWHVQVGDRIEVDAPMLSVETAKAVVEVPSPVSGTVTALHAQPGDRIEIGAPLVEFAIDGSIAASPAQQAAAAIDSGTVVGHMPAAADEFPEAQIPLAHAADAAPRARAVPAARALARSLGVQLDALSGSGPAGLITLADVLVAGGLRAA
ncbi:MAG: biotin/lipoyl-containing protein, partial [Steroidobacteraceae bacterium]